MGAVFTPNPERTFSKQVSFKVPTESGGDQVVNLKTTFKSFPKEELEQMQEDLRDSEAFEKVVSGVARVGDAEGNELPAAKGKELMAQESAFVYEAVMTFYDVMLGGNLKAKTSGKRRATG